MYIDPGQGSLLAAVLFIVGIPIYFIPSIVAFIRRHPNKVPILLINIVGAWTVLGWIVALVWSLMSTDTPSPS